MFSGNNLEITKTGKKISARAYLTGDRVFVRVDHPDFDADQLMRHEAGHVKISRGEIDPDTVRQEMAKRFTPQELDEASENYTAAYDGSGLNSDEIWEEVICDSLGDMNIFSGIPMLEENAQRMLDETKKAVSADIESNRTRGPPSTEAEGGKASRESKYWVPKLTQAQWTAINGARDSQIGLDDHALGDIDAWAYSKKNSDYVFAIYSTENMEEPTMLYACTGDMTKRIGENIDIIKEMFPDGINKAGASDGGISWAIRSIIDQYRNHNGVPKRRGAATGSSGMDGRQSGSGREGNNRTGAKTWRGHIKEKFSMEIPIEKTGRLTETDIRAVQAIGRDGRKSVNQFTSADIAATEKLARQYWHEMGAKSPFFRGWFGDWRANDTAPVVPVQIGINRYQAGNAVNKDTGKKISWGSTLKRETISHLRSNGIADISLGDIANIIENSILLDTVSSRPDSKSKMPGTLFMHSFYSIAEYNGNRYLLKLYVEEASGRKTGEPFTRAYDLKDIKKVATVPNGVLSLTEGLTDGTAATINTVADLFSAVKGLDKTFQPNPPSVVVNEDGTPKMVYHGTAAEFTVFDRTKVRANMDIQGMFFSPYEEDAAGYGPKVRAFYLNIKNPAGEAEAYKALKLFSGQDKAGVKAREYLIEKGYDGVYNGYDEYIAFYPEQIKSATDNIGTFNAGNADIHFSFEPTPGFENRISQASEKGNRKIKETDANHYTTQPQNKTGGSQSVLANNSISQTNQNSKPSENNSLEFFSREEGGNQSKRARKENDRGTKEKTQADDPGVLWSTGREIHAGRRSESISEYRDRNTQEGKTVEIKGNTTYGYKPVKIEDFTEAAENTVIADIRNYFATGDAPHDIVDSASESLVGIRPLTRLFLSPFLLPFRLPS